MYMTCDPFESAVREAIARYGLIPDRDSTALVGLSGGADSVALLAVLCALDYRCVALHCNFHLRGEESMRDQRHAEYVAAELGVTCKVVDFDTRAYMKSHGVSLEMACRELRYDYFGRMISEMGADVMAIAHHRDDNVETFFLNLLRGTGLRGLRGMLPRQGAYIRPLLGLTRADIEQYLQRRHLTYITDSSNAVNDVARNRLRNIVLPVLRQEFADADKAIAATMEILRSNERIYMDAIGNAAIRYVSCDGTRIALSRLADEEAEPVSVLFELLRDHGFNATQVSDMIRSRHNSGRRFRAPECEALINRGELWLRRVVPDAPDGDTEWHIADITDPSQWPLDCDITIIPKDRFNPVRGDSSTLYMDSAALDGNPVWIVRGWREGDRIKPFGMAGSRKLSDIFTDAKLSVDAKRRVRVLTRNDDIVWLVGMRTSRLFPVTGNTSEILKITVLNT